MGSKNFKYLDELIHSGVKEIVLDSDIVLSDGWESEYLEGIKLDIGNLVIDGGGHSIDACGKTRIFHCTGKNITIKNIVLENGFSKEDGGAIHNEKEGILTIKSTTLSGNLMKGSIFSAGSIKSYGGAISNFGKLTLKDSILTDNKAEVEHHTGASSTCEGGAIYNTEEMKISSCEFKNNASERGGAIYTGGTCKIDKSLFENNNSEFNGGAISGTCTINNSELINNCSGLNGGAIYGAVTTKNTKMTGNTAEWGGGAICSYDEEYIKLKNCEIHDNEPNNIQIQNGFKSTVLS